MVRTQEVETGILYLNYLLQNKVYSSKQIMNQI